MQTRHRLAALLGAAALVMALGSVTSAAPPTYGVSLTKSANPTVVPPSGGSVTYTIAVTATGTGFFQTVSVDDGMAGCTLSGPTGDQSTGSGAGKLESGETWTYTCTVTGVTPGTANTAVVNACHNVGACNNTSHDATDSDSVTLGEGPDVTPSPTAPPTDPPATDPPGSADPSGGGGAAVDATDHETDTVGAGTARPGGGTWMLVLTLGLLMATIVAASPTRPERQRRR